MTPAQNARGVAIGVVTLLAIVMGAAGCHSLELSRLRCSTNGRCPTGYSCDTDGYCNQTSAGGGAVRPPGTKPLGEACAAPDDCASGQCADGVCCDTDCTDACRACNLPDNRGSCVAVARGKDPAHGSCATQAASSCGTNGLCDGMGACQFHKAGTVCGDAACDPASNSLTPERRCDGNGVCVAATGGALSCAPFMCNAAGTGCADHCADGDVAACVLPNVCSGGSCGKVGNGIPCRNAAQCQSGFCVDGVCCNAPCSEQCMACDVAGAVGTCSQVPAGSPRGSRPACGGAGTACGGQCTAASATACTYPAAETSCRSASCTNGATSASQTTAASCDGRGACGAGVTSGCGIYMCGAAGACATGCAGDFDCVGGYICQGGVCTARGMTAAPCTATAQCAAGLTCKDGVCCESACDKACRSCAIPGQVGHCALVASADDPDFCAADTRTCDAAGECKLKAGQTCTKPGDCSGGACTTFYPDADGDSFGDMTATVANGRAKAFCGAAPAAGWVTSSGDCCDAGDAMKQVHPGQMAWFTMPSPCGSFDYDCDGTPTPQLTAGGTCDLATPTTCTVGFVADTACGAAGDYQTCDGLVACAAPATQTQACR